MVFFFWFGGIKILPELCSILKALLLQFAAIITHEWTLGFSTANLRTARPIPHLYSSSMLRRTLCPLCSIKYDTQRTKGSQVTTSAFHQHPSWNHHATNVRWRDTLHCLSREYNLQTQVYRSTIYLLAVTDPSVHVTKNAYASTDFSSTV